MNGCARHGDDRFGDCEYALPSTGKEADLIDIAIGGGDTGQYRSISDMGENPRRVGFPCEGTAQDLQVRQRIVVSDCDPRAIESIRYITWQREMEKRLSARRS
jgi:hypothetical protein